MPPRLSAWLNRSIHRRLLVLLIIGLPLLWLGSAGLSFFTARYEVNELFDTEQVLFAQLLASVDLRARQAGAEIHPNHSDNFKELFDDDVAGGLCHLRRHMLRLRPLLWGNSLCRHGLNTTGPHRHQQFHSIPPSIHWQHSERRPQK